jgi:hypothetical protein
MAYRKTLALFLLFYTSTLFVGCQNSPGGIMSPKSDIHVVETSPDVVGPKDSGGGTGDVIEFPNLKVTFGITNGVSVFLDSVAVNYFGQDGRPLASGTYDSYLGLSKLIKAPELGKESTATALPDDVSVDFEVLPYRLFSYMINGTLENYLDDISPIVAKIAIRGRDVNNHEVQFGTQVNLTTLVQKGTGE